MFTWTCKGCFRINQWYLPKCVECGKAKPKDESQSAAHCGKGK